MNICIDWKVIGSKSEITAEMGFPSHFISLGPWSALAWFLFLSRKIQIEFWQLNFLPLFIIQWQAFKMTPGTKKINYYVIFHAVVVDSVCLHMLSINIAGCFLKEIWAHTQVLLEGKSWEDKVCVYLSCSSCFDLFHRVPSWDFLVFSLLRTSSSLFVNKC